MSRKWIPVLCAVMVLALGACSLDDDPSDPVAVDSSLPSVSQLSWPENSTAVTEADAEDLADEVLSAILDSMEGLSGGLSLSVNPGGSRAVMNENFNETWNAQWINGLKVSGFVTGSATASIADESIPFGTPGDSASINIRAKMAVDYDNVKVTTANNGSLTINGKYYFSGDPVSVSGKVDSDGITVNGTINLNGGYSFVVVHSTYGAAKVIFDLKVRGIKPITIKADGSVIPSASDLFTADLVFDAKLYDSQNNLVYTREYDLDYVGSFLSL